MLQVVSRKIANNKWLVFCLLVGCMLAVAVASTIPMYADGILQRMLIQEFEALQESREEHPSVYRFTGTFGVIGDRETKRKLYEFYDAYIENRMAPSLPMDIIGSYNLIASSAFTVLDDRNWDLFYQENVERKPLKTVWTTRGVAYGIYNFENLVQLVGGRMYSPQVTEDGVYEVVVTRQAMRMNGYVLDGIYTVTESRVSTEYLFKFKVVGMVEMREEASTFYILDHSGIYMHPELFKSDFVDPQRISIARTEWFYAYDFYQLSIADAGRIVDIHENNQQWIRDNHGYLRQNLSFLGMLQEYTEKSNRLSVMLILLVIPILVMIAFYVSMIAQLIMDQEKNEIAMLESRGASRKQIFSIYLFESIIIGIISLVLGLFLAIGMCRILGASSGFMEFVDRRALDIRIGGRAVLYGTICMLFYIIMMLIPAYKASRYTIVEFKQGKALLDKKPFWHKLYLDVILLVISIFALTNYNRFKDMIAITEEGQIDYLVFFSITFFILGLALVFLRFYPYLVNLVFHLGKRIWTPSMYAAFTYVGRGGNMRQFIMIFLILALGVGIFNANSARTINENHIDRIRFRNGTDIRLMLNFTTLRAVENPGSVEQKGSPNVAGQFEEVEGFGRTTREVELIREYEGVEHLARVVHVPSMVTNRANLERMETQIISIKPEEFGNVVWSRPDLMDVHINYYLNLLAEHPHGVIISAAMAETLNVTPGMFIEIVPSDVARTVIEAPVIAIVNNWPAFNQHVNPTTGRVQDETTTYGLCIMHIDLLQIHFRGDIQYELWIDKKDGLLDSEFNTFLTENEISLQNASFTDFQISELRREPMLLGLNGVLTLNFLITMLICGAGFIIFWALSIQQRMLQFGIFRAMGLKKRELISMIIWEQILISVVAIILGIVISGITSEIFMSLFQIAETAEGRILGFVTYSDRSDYIRIYALMGAMLAVGIAVIARFINRIKMDRAVKLGED